MKTKSVGIIAEYNPFHNGHLYHLNKSKELTDAKITIAAISGNFVQRGKIAMADKWQRAEAAVKCGADLVVEIPVVFACNSAPYFAKAGVEILENLGVDFISFGSESGNIDELYELDRAMETLNEDIEGFIKEKVKEGLSCPRARREAVDKLIGEKGALILDKPNNILALEYIKAMKTSQGVTVQRKGPGYNDIEVYEELASATAIRYLLKEEADISHLLPQMSFETLKSNEMPSEEILFKMICQNALVSDAKDLDKTPTGGEGLGNKLKNSIRKISSYEELIEELKSKRYTRTRIERFLIQTLLKINQENAYKNYIRVLGFNAKGSAYLKEIKKADICKLPIITNINKDIQRFPEIDCTLSKDILAMDIYNMATQRDLYSFSEHVRKPFVE